MHPVCRILVPIALLALSGCFDDERGKTEFPSQTPIADTAWSYADLFFRECIERKNFSTIADLAASDLKRRCSRIFQSEGDYARCAQPILDWYE